MPQELTQQRRDLDDMPMLHVFPSLFCNLKCPYCTQQDHLLEKPESDFLLSEEFLAKVRELSGIHFILSGGEPFLNVKGLKNLIRLAVEKGHVLSFHTNLSMPRQILADILEGVPSRVLGEVLISHHLHANVDDDRFIGNVMYLHGLGMAPSVKYIAIPGDLGAIATYMDFWEGRNISSYVAGLMGPWEGRNFPEEYTEEELKTIIPMTNNISTSLQFLGGLESRGLPCRAGNDYFSWNISGKREKISCCQGIGNEVDWDKTYFVTGVKQSVPCSMPLCWTSNMIDPVTRIEKEFRKSVKDEPGRHPTISELVTVARRIETKTGRVFSAWPAFLVELSRERGLGTAGEVAIPVNLKEVSVFSRVAGDLASSLEMRSFGGSATLAVVDNCVRLKTVSANDSLRTPFFKLSPSSGARKFMTVVFDRVHFDLGDFSWRMVLQNYRLETLAKSTFHSSSKAGDAPVVTIRRNIAFYMTDDLPVRLIFAPVGGAEKPYVLSEGLEVSLYS